LNVPQNALTSTKRSTSKQSENSEREDDDQSMGNGISGSE